MAAKYKKNDRLDYALSTKVKKALDKAAIVLQNEVKENLSDKPGGLQVRTGTLRRSIQIDRSEIDNYKIKVGTNVVYAAIHEFGGIIKAVTAKYLKFKIDGFWKSKKSVVIPARPFLRPALSSAKQKMLNCFKNII